MLLNVNRDKFSEYPKRIQEVRENCRAFLPDALKRSEFPVGKERNIKVKYTLKYFYFHKEENIEFSFLSALWWQIRKRETFEGFINTTPKVKITS